MTHETRDATRPFGPTPIHTALVALAGFAVMADPAFAACPSGPEDARKGLTVTFDDGALTELTLRADGLVEEVVPAETPEESDWVGLSHYGIWLTETYETHNGVVVDFTPSKAVYPEGSEAFVQPTPDLVWSGLVVWDQGTPDAMTETHDISIGQPTSLAAGECRYDMLPVKIGVTFDGGRSTDYVFYFPELEVGLLVGWEAEGDYWRPMITGIELTE